MGEGESRSLGSTQTRAQKNTDERPVAFALERRTIRRRGHLPGLTDREPVPEPHASPSGAFDLVDPGCQVLAEVGDHDFRDAC